MKKSALFYAGSPIDSGKGIKEVKGIFEDTEVPIRNMELSTEKDFRRYRHMLMGILTESHEERSLIFVQFRIENCLKIEK